MDANNVVKIHILGEGGVGKSAVTMSLIRSRFVEEYDPTIEDSYSTSRTIDGINYTLEITDTAGQEEYRGLWQSSQLAKADAFLLVYDITSPPSLAALADFDELIIACTDESPDPVRKVKVLVGNKCDLPAGRQISSGEGLSWARSRGMGFMETSAKLKVNVEETFALIIRRVVQARQDAVQNNNRGAAREKRVEEETQPGPGPNVVVEPSRAREPDKPHRTNCQCIIM